MKLISFPSKLISKWNIFNCPFLLLLVCSSIKIYRYFRDLDFINLMSYDLHGSLEANTGHHSALYGRSGEVGTAASMNVVRFFLK